MLPGRSGIGSDCRSARRMPTRVVESWEEGPEDVMLVNWDHRQANCAGNEHCGRQNEDTVEREERTVASPSMSIFWNEELQAVDIHVQREKTSLNRRVCTVHDKLKKGSADRKETNSRNWSVLRRARWVVHAIRHGSLIGVSEHALAGNTIRQTDSARFAPCRQTKTWRYQHKARKTFSCGVWVAFQPSVTLNIADTVSTVGSWDISCS
jgi:hypothetical protein